MMIPNKQRGTVAVTASLLITMTAMLASVSLRSATVSVAMGHSYQQQAMTLAAAERTLSEQAHTATLTIGGNERRIRTQLPHDILVETTIRYLGRTATIAHPTFDADRDQDITMHVFVLATHASSRRGAASTRGVYLMQLASASQQTGVLMPSDSALEERLGTLRWTTGWH
ncbi:MAG: hypothetical protein AAF290_07655 [Pseudomonadota bacterium]